MWQFTLILFLLLFACCKSAQISSALYENYALVGMLPTGADPNTKFSYAALLSREPNVSFHVTTVFHLDDTVGFGASVALGQVAVGDGDNTTIAAIASKMDTGDISIFNVASDCSTEGCNAWITYQTTSTKSSCSSGATVVAGTNFVASFCPSNLLRKNEDHKPGPPPAFTVCTINDLFSGSCHLLNDVPLEVEVCSGKGGQLVVSAMDARADMLVIGYCAVCSVESGNTLSMKHSSGFAVYHISSESVSPIYVGSTKRTASCPSSVAVNAQWVIVGYAAEGGVDFYSTPTNSDTYNYTLLQSVNQDTPIGYGAYVDCSETLAIVGGSGEVASNSFGAANIYTIGVSQKVNFTEQLIQTTIPCINYPVQFNYTFSVNLYEGTILVVTQDSGLISWGFDAFDTCPYGMGWSAVTGQCEDCPPGQHKETYNVEANFDLCVPCHAGEYSNTSKRCAEIPCGDGAACPAGSPVPIYAAPKFLIDSIPSPQATDPLDFEDTFYFSCYPYFILFLTLIIAIAIPICCTWPNKTMAQKKLVTRLLNVNFFYWPSGDEENFFMDEPKESLLSINSDMDEEDRKEALDQRRRTHIDQFIGSLCSYFVSTTFILMIVFGLVFMSHGYNNSIEIDLQTIDQSLTVANETYIALNLIDQGAFSINVLLIGYNGQCTTDEVILMMYGCYTINYQTPCSYNLSVVNTADGGNVNCSVTASFEPSNLQQQAKFSVHFKKPDFYAQQVVYNVSTANNDSAVYTGNAFVAGAFLPSAGNILRGNVTTEILSILTYIGDCESVSDDRPFAAHLVRVSVMNCTPNHLSYKSLSFLSDYSDEIPLQNYNFLNASGFTYNLLLTKSPFYKNVYQTYFVSLGTILNLLMFAALDVYWIVEAMCPWLGFIIFHIQSVVISLRNRNKKPWKR